MDENLVPELVQIEENEESKAPETESNPVKAKVHFSDDATGENVP